jgi:endoglucanase
MTGFPLRSLLVILCLCVSAQPGRALDLVGVNLSGAEFGRVNAGLPGAPYGRPGRDYVWPGDGVIRDWAAAGARVIRVPFRWERVQPVLRGPVDTAELRRIVNTASAAGLSTILDLHNYGNRWVEVDGVLKQAQIDGPSALVTRADYADLWRKLAQAFAGDERVHFDLMNEPHDLKSADGATEAVQLARIYQAGLDAVRAAGAGNVIHIEPPRYAKASALVGSFSEAALTIRDPRNALVFHVHQYLDPDESGRHAVLAGGDHDLGVKRLAPVTEWARRNGKRLFLGEFGLPAGGDPDLLEASRRMLTFIHASDDVWAGWTAWGAGSLWKSDYPFRLNPADTASPSLQLMRDFFAK